MHVGVEVCRPQYMCGDQWSTCLNEFSLSTVWAVGIKLRSSGLAAAPSPTDMSHWPM